MWVHTCNVTAYRNAVTLQVTDAISSCELNFHPVPHDVTVSCERYAVGFPFVTGARAMSLQLAAASYFCIHCALKKKRKERRWRQRQLYTSREVYSGSGLLAELNFQSVRGLYKNFTRMSPSEFEFLIRMEKKSRKRTQHS